MILSIPMGVYGKEIVSINRINYTMGSILYDDYTVEVRYRGPYTTSSVVSYRLDGIKDYIHKSNSNYEYLYIGIDNNLYASSLNSSSKTLVLENVKRFLTDSVYSYSSGLFIETNDNKIYLLKEKDDRFSNKENKQTIGGNYLYLIENNYKEIKYFNNGTIYYTIDDSDDLYAIGNNTIGNKINDGNYLSDKILVLENVKKFSSNLILNNNNELYLASSSLARPVLIKTDVDDFVVKTGSLVYIKDIFNKGYRFYVYVDGDQYIRRLEELPTSDIYNYDDSQTRNYHPSGDYFSYPGYPYVYRDGNVYCNEKLIMEDVIYFSDQYIITKNGNLYLDGSYYDTKLYSHLTYLIHDELQLIDRNVKEIYSNLTSDNSGALIYQKKDNTIWAFGSPTSETFLKLFNNVDGYQYPFCVIGDCDYEIILENLNINNVLVNQQFDFYVNTYPSNAEKLDVIWKSSDESIATVDNTGYITTLKPGEVTITATVNNQVSDSVKLNVMDDSNVFQFEDDEDFKLYIGEKRITFNDNLGDYDNEFDITYSDGISSAHVVDKNIIRVYATSNGKQTITFTSKNGKYTKTYEFDVIQNINDFKIKPISAQYATGKELKPKIEIDGLVEGKDFTVEYENNINPGNYGIVKVTGIGYYYGTMTVKFYINFKGYFSNLTFPILKDHKYTGEQIKPKIELEGLVEGVDYSVTYDENTNIGWGFVYITGLTYSGKKDIKFYIAPADIEYEVNDYEIYYDELEHSIDLNVKTEGVKIEYAVNSEEYSEIKPMFKDSGTYKVKFILSKPNHNDVRGESTFTIKDLMYIEYDYISFNSVEYDGEEHTINLGVYTPDVVVKYMDQDGNYTLDEAPKYKDVGEYRIDFMVTKENYYPLIEWKILNISPLRIEYTSNDYQGIYDKKEHTIELNVSTPGVTVKYLDQNGNYSLDEAPKFIEPGTRLVWFQLTKKNYETVWSYQEVIIESPKIPYEYNSSVTMMYDGKEHGLELNVLEDISDLSIMYAYNNEEYWTSESPKYSEVGEYVIKYCLYAPMYESSCNQTVLRIVGIKDEYKEQYRIVDNKYLVLNKMNVGLNDIEMAFNFFDLKMEYLLNDKKDYKDILKTNDVLKLKDEPLVYFYDKSYIISILGEVTGDGKINYLDYVNVYNHIYKSKHPESNKKLLSGASLISADMSDDGKINYLDYVKIYNKIKELKGGSN